MTIEILDPTSEVSPEEFVPADRLPALDGMTVGIISNGKYGTAPFFDALERELVETCGVASVLRRTKTNYSAPAGSDLIDEAARWNVVVAGVGD